MATCTLSVLEPLPINSQASQNDPHRSPAKQFSPDDARMEVFATATASRQEKDLAAVLRSMPTKVDTGLQHYGVYETVLQVYSAVREGKGPLPHFADAGTMRIVYQAVLEVTYHQQVIEEMLTESGFYARHFDLHGHESLVLIMAYDFQKERFKLRPPRDSYGKLPEMVLRVAEALWKHKVKLNATLARMRVKANALVISQLIAETTRQKYEQTVNQPYYARVNPLKVGSIQSDVIAKLCCSEGLAVVNTENQLLACRKAVYQHHGDQRDLLAFSSDCRGFLSNHELVKEGCLVLQDLASYQFVEGFRHQLEQCYGNVIVTDCNAGVEAAHIAGILGDRGTVLIFGVLPVQTREVQEKMLSLGLHNVQLLQAPFKDATPTDKLLEGVAAVVCLPPSSLSTVSNPVDFISQEGDQHAFSLLGQANRCVGVRTFAMGQMYTLSHALNFSQSNYVIYGTRSACELENGSMVSKALDGHRMAVEREEVAREFALLSPSSEGSGYFTAVFERMPAKPAPLPKEVIAGAIARGILQANGILEQQQIKRPRKAKKPHQKIFSHHDGIPMTFAAQQKIVQKKQHKQSPARPFR